MSLPPGKTHADALKLATSMRETIWRSLSEPEDRKIEELTRYCTRLYGGDRKAGQKLATDAIWN